MARHVQHPPWSQNGRHAHAAPTLELAVADSRDVDGDEQHIEACIPRTGHQGASELALERIQLEEVAFVGGLCDLLDRPRRRGREDETSSLRLGCSRGCEVAAPVRQAGHARRREQDRQVDAFAGDGGREVAFRMACEDSRNE
jgi:hypothetical protein